MGRTLVATGTPGWYRDLADPEGSKVRKQDGDEILTAEQVAASGVSRNFRTGDAQPADAEPTDAVAQANGNRGTDAAKAAVAAAKPPQPTTVAETGKLLVGKTVQIECKWDGCTAKRTIKPQDQFQVRFCVEHQTEHRKEVRRQKQRERAARRKAEREATKAQEVSA